MLSGTIVCAVEGETQKARYENLFRHKDVQYIPTRAKEIWKRRILLILERSYTSGYCAPRFGLSMLFNAIFNICTYIAQNCSLISIGLYRSLPSASMACLDLFPRIAACAHSCLFFSGYLCIFTVWWQELHKRLIHIHGGLLADRTGALAEQGMARCDAMRCEDQRGSNPAN